MDELNEYVAINLRRIRKSKNLSLDAVATETGISKSMLGQIERGQSNPTIAVLGKLVRGLRIEFSDLVNKPQEETVLIESDKLKPSREVQNKFRIFSYFPYEKNRNFEVYRIEIEPGQRFRGELRRENASEYLIVNQGELTLMVDEQVQVAKDGDAIRLNTDKPHFYINRSREKLQFDCICSFA